MRLKKLDILNKPYKIYAEHLESGAIEQFIAVMAHESIVKGALMPDAHQGYSLPIGGVVAAKGMIFPSYIGFDQGCGMCALKTPFKVEDIKEHAKEIYDRIYEVIPVGFNVHEEPQHSLLDPNDLSDMGMEAFYKRKGFRSLGTLGGGNHFIEIGHDETDAVWIVIHSGSRGVGHGIATEYMKIAGGGKAREGNYGLDVTSRKGMDYINDLEWCLKFALANREMMINNVFNAISSILNATIGDYPINSLPFINRNHNHAELRDGLWIHRKGATHAEDGMMGVIPGNMRDGSFIVKGKGNPDSLYSSSHGAGRVLGRRKAKETLDMEDFKSQMEGITASVSESTLDESPSAYKDIYEVMRLQSDLVEVLHHVKPIINIKG